MAETEQTGERPIDPPLARVLKGEASQEEEAAVREWRRASYENEVEYRELVRVVEWSERTRELREVALEGRGFFAIAHDGTPFVIRTDAGNVTVLGTRLDLEARGRGLRVVVVEGRVALSTPRARTQLSAGEMARVLNGEPTPVVKVPDVES